MLEMEKLNKYQTELLEIPLADLIIVTDPNHPLYDRRAKEPRSAELADKLAAQGQLQNIVVVPAPDEGKYLVVAGRRRTKAAEGVLDSLLAKVYDIPPSEELALFELKIAENADRQELTFLDRAFEIRDYEQFLMTPDGKLPHGSTNRICDVFNITRPALGDSKVILMGSKELLKAVREEKVSATRAIEWIKATNKNGEPNHEKQNQKLDSELNRAEKEGKQAVGNRQEEAVIPIGSRPITGKELKFLAELPDTGKALRPLFKYLSGTCETEEERQAVIQKYDFLYHMEPDQIEARQAEELAEREKERLAKEKAKAEAAKQKAELLKQKEAEKKAKEKEKEKLNKEKEKAKAAQQAAQQKAKEAAEKAKAKAKEAAEKAKQAREALAATKAKKKEE